MKTSEITFMILLIGGVLVFAGVFNLLIAGVVDCKENDSLCSKNKIMINGIGFDMLYAGGGCMLFSILCTWIDDNEKNKISKCDHNGKLMRGVTSWPKEEPGIFKTKITCLKCNCNGYIETNTEKNTQRIIWDEKK